MSQIIPVFYMKKDQNSKILNVWAASEYDLILEMTRTYIKYVLRKTLYVSHIHKLQDHFIACGEHCVLDNNSEN